jgi:hypothetical protein
MQTGSILRLGIMETRGIERIAKHMIDFVPRGQSGALQGLQTYRDFVKELPVFVCVARSEEGVQQRFKQFYITGQAGKKRQAETGTKT